MSQEWLPAEPEPARTSATGTVGWGPVPGGPTTRATWRAAGAVIFDFHGGGILEWGAHTVDLCQIGNSADDTAPIEYVPNESGVECTYANGVKLVMRTDGWLGLGTCSIRYVGDEGWVETGDSGAMQDRTRIAAGREEGLYDGGHVGLTRTWRNFLDCVKSRRLTRANASVAGQSHIVCHAAYIAWQLGRTLKFDPVEGGVHRRRGSQPDAQPRHASPLDGLNRVETRPDQ